MSEWQNWLQAKTQATASMPLRLRTMHLKYGAGPEGEKCGNCCHLITQKYAGTYFKCGLTKITGGPGTDWRKRWPACGAFTREGATSLGEEGKTDGL